MRIFAVIALLPTLFVSWLSQQPGPFRGVEAIGGAIPILGAGLLAIHVARRMGSAAPYRWGAGVTASWAFFMFLGSQ